MRADLVDLIDALDKLTYDSESTVDADTGDDATFLPIEVHDFDALIDRAVSALRALRDAPVGWRPIETAPRDGAEILLYAPACEFQGRPVAERVTFGHWMQHEGGTIECRDADGRWIGQDDDEGFEGWMSWDGGFTAEHPPTHWMPLPEPPEPRP